MVVWLKSIIAIQLRTVASCCYNYQMILSGVTKHHEDFVKCDDVIAADRAKECMRSQWSNQVVPGQKLK